MEKLLKYGVSKEVSLAQPAQYINYKTPVQAVTPGEYYFVEPETRGGKLGYKYITDDNTEGWALAEHWRLGLHKKEQHEGPFPQPSDNYLVTLPIDAEVDLAKVEGKKFDQDYLAKPPVDLIPPKALLEVGKVIGFGAKKYGEGNYLKIQDARRYVAAAQRHLMQNSFEENDPESELLHLAHAACSILMAIEAQLNHGRKEWYVTD